MTTTSSEALKWLCKGNKGVRVAKLAVIVIVLYWLLHFLSEELKRTELFLCFALYMCFLAWSKFRKKRNLRLSGIREIDNMSVTEFEQKMRLHFRDLGWKPKGIRLTGYFGADLILRTPDGQTIVAQLKRYSEKVGLSAVQEAVAAVAFYKADGAMVITNNYLTDSARRLAKANGVVIWQRDELVQSLAQTQVKTPRRI